MTDQAATRTHGAQVLLIPPPLYYGALFAIGMLLDAAVPLAVGARPATAWLGAAIGLAGLALTFCGVIGVIRHRTTIVPHRPVAKLITTGAYRLSRNPMYTGLAIAYVGGALLAGSWWPTLLLPIVLLLVARLVIRPEEQYLQQHFGQVYAGYQANVRRWF